MHFVGNVKFNKHTTVNDFSVGVGWIKLGCYPQILKVLNAKARANRT